LVVTWLFAQYQDATDQRREEMARRLNLIGRDCCTLEKGMAKYLRSLAASPVGRALHRELGNLALIWERWSQAARHIWAVQPSPQQVAECERDCLLFTDAVIDASPSENITWYLHHVREHVAQYTRMLYDEFGLGFGFLTTQSMEHRLKFLKSHISRHTFQNSGTIDRFFVVLACF
jgi:hypothetical protein